MKSKSEHNRKILVPLANVYESYYELTKFGDDTTIPIPSQIKPKITTSHLPEDKDSLKEMVKGHALSSIEHFFIIGAGLGRRLK
jgi:hypothetical protein